MYQFLFLGHTSLNYIYAEHRHRDLLAEAERERQLALVPALRFTWRSVFPAVKAGLQALRPARIRVTDIEAIPPGQSLPDKPLVARGLRRAGRRPWLVQPSPARRGDRCSHLCASHPTSC
jgi:hypothetical protein